jgi:hypothetical protein
VIVAIPALTQNYGGLRFRTLRALQSSLDEDARTYVSLNLKEKLRLCAAGMDTGASGAAVSCGTCFVNGKPRILDCRHQVVEGHHPLGAARGLCCVSFSLYNEKAADHDQKLAENREDAQGIMLLVRHASPFRRALQCSPKHPQSGVSYQLQSEDSFRSLILPLRQALKRFRPFISARSTNCKSGRTHLPTPNGPVVG